MASDSEEEPEFEPETFCFDQHTLTVTTIAYMPLTLLAANHGKGLEISGNKLWCGSLCLISYIMENPSTVDGKVVIELGAGTGVVSMLSLKYGAAAAVATDHDNRCIEHMRADATTNGAMSMDVLRLDWFSPDISKVVSSVNSSEVVILAGDVLYKNTLLKPFFHTVKLIFQTIAKIDMFLCHIPRAGVSQDMIQEEATNNGFTIDFIPRSSYAECNSSVFQYCPTEDLDKAALYHIHVN